MLKFLLFKAQSSISHISDSVWLAYLTWSKVIAYTFPFLLWIHKALFFQVLGKSCRQIQKGGESSQPLDYHWHNCKCRVTVAFFLLAFYISIVFSLWNRPADWHILLRYFGKTPILSPCFSIMLILLYEGNLAEYEFQNEFCRMLGFPPRSLVGYRALPTHPYLLFITSDWTVALETVIMSQVTSLWLNEGKKIEQKRTFLLQHATWKLKLSHIHSLYFRALFGNGTDLSF